MEFVFGIGTLAALGLLVVISERTESRQATVRVWSDEYERRLASGRRGWPLE